MSPEAALERQIEKYRSMTGEERLSLAFRLHELSCDVAREGIRAQFPDAHSDAVEEKLRERLKLAREL